ncbi:MAG: TonB-dependent receptor [Bacteroidia bacterium]|nr:TonB-dependent receptor [Bacteroidia bacterium]
MKRHFILLIGILSFANISWGQLVLQGSVYDKHTGLPLHSVTISIKNSSRSTITNKDGFFKIEDLEEGVYYLDFYKEGYYPATSDYELRKKEEEKGKEKVEINVVQIFSVGISLKRKQTEVETAHVFASQLVDRKPIHTPHSVSVYESWRSKDEILLHMPEGLDRIVGLSNLEYFHGGNNILLRGLGGSRLPIFLDGLELTRATSPLDYNLALMTVDPLAIDRTEVLRGTGSVQQGSDATSGSIVMSSKKAVLSQSGWQVHGELIARGGIGLNGSSGMNPIYDAGMRGEILVSGPKIGLRAGASGYGDRNFIGPNFRLDSSGYRRDFQDLDLKFALGEKQEIQLSHHRGSVENVNQQLPESMGQLVDGELEKLERQSSKATFIAYEPDTYLDKVEISLGVQQWHEKQNYKGPNGIWNYQDRLTMFSGDISVTSQPIPYWQVVSGVSFTQQQNQDIESSYQSFGNGTEQIRGRIPDNAIAGDFSLFTAHTLDVLKLRLSFGGRAHAYRRDFLDQERTPVVLVGNISGMYPLHPNYKLYFSSQTGYKAPNLYDFAYQGPIDFGFATPADSLNPERTFSSEVGLKASTTRFNGSVALYRTQISDYLDWRQARFEGSQTFQGLPVYSIQPTGQAYIQGIEAELEVKFSTSMVVFGNIAYTYGKNISQTQALPMVPPLNGRLGLRYQNRRGIWSRLEWRYADRQDRVGFTDLPNPRINNAGTPAWNVIDFHVGWRHSLGYANLGIKNLLNSNYTVHGSGLPGMGRLILISVQLGF